LLRNCIVKGIAIIVTKNKTALRNLLIGTVLVILSTSCSSTVGQDSSISNHVSAEIHDKGLFYYDFDLFSITPKYVFSGDRLEPPYLSVNKSDSAIGIVIKTWKAKNDSILIHLENESGYWSDTIPALKNKGYSYLHFYKIDSRFAVLFEYKRDYSYQANWALSRISAVSPNMCIIEADQFSKKARRIGRWPRMGEAQRIFQKKIIQTDQNILVERKCIVGLCDNNSSKLILRNGLKRQPKISAFWYWLYSSTIAIEFPI
jgi:hypothetical protein